MCYVCVCAYAVCVFVCITYLLVLIKSETPQLSLLSQPPHTLSPFSLSLFSLSLPQLACRGFSLIVFSTIFSSLLMLLLLLISVFVVAVVIVVVAFVVNETFYLCALFAVALIPSLCHATHSHTHTASHTRTHTASHTPSHSLTYSPIHSLTHSAIHSLIHSYHSAKAASTLFRFFSAFSLHFSLVVFPSTTFPPVIIIMHIFQSFSLAQGESPPLSLSLPCRALAIKILFLHISLDFSVISIRISHLVFANPLWLSSFPPHT